MRKSLFIIAGLLLCLPEYLMSIDIDSLLIPLKNKNNDNSKVDILNDMSFKYRFSDFELSNNLAEKALDISDSLGYLQGKACALKNIGTVKWNYGNFAEAKELYFKSLIIYEKLNDTNGICRLWNNIGLIDITQNEYDEAIEKFRKSSRYCEMMNDIEMLCKTELNIGISYFYLKQYEVAIDHHKKSNEYAERCGDTITLASNYCFIGNEYTMLNKYDMAIEYLNKALILYIKVDAKRDIAHTYNLLAHYYLTTKDYRNAVKYADLAYDLAHKLSSVVNLQEATNILSQAWSNLGNYKLAYQQQTMTIKYLIELNDQKNKQTLANLTTKYNYEKKLHKLEADKLEAREEQEREIYIRNLIITVISIVSVLVIIFAIILYKINVGRKRKNQLLQQQNTQIAEQKIKLEEMNSELHSLNVTKDKFFSIIAHDLKNPIANLKSLSEIIQADYSNMETDERAEYINLMSISSGHVLALLENLLTWSRSQRNTIEFNPSIGNLAQLIATTVQGAELSARNKSIELKVDIDDRHSVYADFNMLNTIIRNIISNAIKFTPRDGCIKVSSLLNGKFTEISISDSGVGIPSEKIDTLFQVGSNISTNGTENEGGTGLGLIICKEFAERNGGDIEVKSQPGQGTEFIIKIPNQDNTDTKKY